MNLLEEYSLSELILTDIQFLGLDQKAWEFSRGMRKNRDYCDDLDNVIVKDSYEYVLSNGNRDVESYTRKIEWFEEDGTLIQEKMLSVPQNIKSIKSVNREIRQGRVDYLEAAADELRVLADSLPEPYKTQYITVADSIDLLFTHYDVEITHYIQRGTMEWETAVINESDPQISAILAIQTRQPDADFPNGLTVQQSIIHQMTGEVP